MFFRDLPYAINCSLFAVHLCLKVTFFQVTLVCIFFRFSNGKNIANSEEFEIHETVENNGIPYNLKSMRFILKNNVTL